MRGKRCDDVVHHVSGAHRRVETANQNLFLCYKRRSVGRRETGQDRNPTKRTTLYYKGDDKKNGFCACAQALGRAHLRLLLPHEHIEGEHYNQLAGGTHANQICSKVSRNALNFLMLPLEQDEKERPLVLRMGYILDILELRGLVASRPMVV